MRNVMIALLAAVVALFTVSMASAQETITLGPSLTQIQFLATGGGNFNMTTCSNVSNKGVCTAGYVQGTAAGGGNVSGYGGWYSIWNQTAVHGTLTNGQGCNVCNWTLSGSMNFEWTTGKNQTGTDLLNGTFTLVSMSQTKNIIGAGFNQSLVVNFTPTGGLLENFFENNPTIILNLSFTTAKSIANDPKGNMRYGWINNGQVSATPEPGTMALLGSGFLLVGGYLRKKFGA
jgi:PEP-CTERM motif-containing protein